MSIMHSEWEGRLKHWIRTLKDDFYQPVEALSFRMFSTMDELSVEEAKARFASGEGQPVKEGFVWGDKYEYGWFLAEFTLPETCRGERVVLNLNPGGESTLFVNDLAFGNYRADWVREPHHFMVDNWITKDGREGEPYSLLMEVYAGHFFPEASGCATGPVLPGSFQDPKTDGERARLGHCSFGIWNEEAYQLYMDVDTLYQLLQTLDESSLRASKIAEGLEAFTLTVDFEAPREMRIASYREARKLLRPLLEAKNGTTMPQFYAIGNSHLDLAWLWPMQETYRKTARTFGAQLRLLEEYPDYMYIQSQPASYEMCRKYYPELFERIKAAIKEGRWIADGAMWVEPDTNMAGGEALVRQLLYGRAYYRDVLGVESETLWLPDTFGYSGALPQILKGFHVKSLVTQKIFWSYNEGEKFPYHYFNWEGIDGSKVVSFLPTSYTYYTNPTEANRVWQNRTQMRHLDSFLFPYGYGDGGGGPTRDYIEYIERQKDLEGSVRIRHASPQAFFEEKEAEGGPKETYRGELYFSAHRGTYTSQAKVKENNRRAELSLRDRELLESLNAWEGRTPYPKEELEEDWKELLLHQFHDILPGSGIGEIYAEAEERVGKVIKSTEEHSAKALALMTSGEHGFTLFNSLSFPRKALVALPKGQTAVQTAKGEAVAHYQGQDGTYILASLPPLGAVSFVPAAQEKASARPLIGEETDGGFVLSNSLVKVFINQRGEVTSYERQGREYAKGIMNRFLFYKDVPRLFDAWDIDSNYILQPLEGARDVTARLLASSEAYGAVEVEGKIGDSTYRQVIRLNAEEEVLTFDTTVDWKELHRLLKVAFPVDVYADEAIHEIQYGYVKRPVHRSRLYDKDRFEVCNHRYSALCDGGHGFAVLNRTKYGISVNENQMELTLLKAAASPEMRADNRVHHFTYAIMGFEGSFEESSVVKEGLKLNVAPLCAEGTLDAFSLACVDKEHIFIDAVKLAEDGSGDLILRLYEAAKTACNACLTLPLSARAVFETDMEEANPVPVSLEKHEDKTLVSLSFRPFEIKTLRVKK